MFQGPDKIAFIFVIRVYESAKASDESYPLLYSTKKLDLIGFILQGESCIHLKGKNVLIWSLINVILTYLDLRVISLCINK